MHPDLEAFRYCPACGVRDLVLEHGKALRCGTCGFRYFHNVAAAVSAVIHVGDEVLFARRARAPRAGTLDFPGGFVDPDESLESGLCRELAEELGLALLPADAAYLFSSWNRYPFEGVTYRTADIYFGFRLAQRPTLRCADDVADAEWRRLDDVDPAELSFPTMADAVVRLRSGALAGRDT